MANTKEYREANKDKINAWKKKYRESHKEQLAAYFKEHFQVNKDAILKTQRKRRDRRKEIIDRNCEICGAAFKGTVLSKRCENHRYRSTPVVLICKCGKEFTGIKSRSFYCPECKLQRERDKRRKVRLSYISGNDNDKVLFVGFDKTINQDWEDEDFALAMKGRLMGIGAVRSWADDGGLPVGTMVKYRSSVLIMRDTGLVPAQK